MLAKPCHKNKTSLSTFIFCLMKKEYDTEGL